MISDEGNPEAIQPQEVPIPKVSKAQKRQARRGGNPHRMTRTTTEAAAILGVPVRSVRAAALAGQFEYVMVGTRMYLLVPSIEQRLGGRSLIELEQQITSERRTTRQTAIA